MTRLSRLSKPCRARRRRNVFVPPSRSAFARSTLIPLPTAIQWSKVLRPSERSASRPPSTILCSSADRTSSSGCRCFDMMQGVHGFGGNMSTKEHLPLARLRPRCCNSPLARDRRWPWPKKTDRRRAVVKVAQSRRALKNGPTRLACPHGGITDDRDRRCLRVV
jgi:hypothetical protein